VYAEVDGACASREFSSVETPVEMFHAASAELHLLEYARLPIADDAAPAETVRRRIIGAAMKAHFFVVSLVLTTARVISTNNIIRQTIVQHCRTSDLELTATRSVKLRLFLSLYFQIQT